ncbi:MAG TPA: hypothetical protein ENG51_11980 [Deltaproteobacteria bacterium]|nr:hypothetical protein [Deltaproteobacteria bacterium]
MKKLLAMAITILLVLSLTHRAHAKGWEYQKSGTNANLNDVFFINQEVGWAVGDNGTILFTKDGGEKWVDLSASAEMYLPQLVPYRPFCSFKAVQFVSLREGWVAGKVELPVMELETTSPFPMEFGIILHTEDGGESWKIQYPWDKYLEQDIFPAPALTGINDIFFLTPTTGWAVGDGFAVLETKNGGKTWKELPIEFSVIPEFRISLMSTKWISPLVGWVVGYEYDMNAQKERIGFIARTRDGGESWDKDVHPNNLPQLNDIEIKVPWHSITDCINCFRLPAWSVGYNGTILHLTEYGWKYQHFPWPLCMPIPDFYATGFVDDKHGWIVGFREKYLNPTEEPNPLMMTIFHTSDGGENWQVSPFGDKGKLNGIALAGATDAWAVGDKGVIIHYQNSPPEICRAWAEPQLVEAGQEVEFFVSVKDFDGPDDIEKVTVDMKLIGGDVVELEREFEDIGDRRCVLYKATAEIPALAPYGLHLLPVEVVDKDGAKAKGVIEVFVVTCFVKIEDTWAKPNPVRQGSRVLLAAKVRLLCPKGVVDEASLPEGKEIKIDKVRVDITELLGVDCGPDMDCRIIADMEDPDGDGVYTCLVKEVTGSPGTYELPVWATDTLGHIDKSVIKVGIIHAGCLFDSEPDGDVDGVDLAVFAERYQSMINPLALREFAAEYGHDDCFER